jgi:hypothetical protein
MMKRTHKIAIGLIGSMSLGLAVAVADAHPGRMGGGMGPGMMGGMGPMAMRGGMGPGAMGAGFAGPAAMQQLMTPEERTATINKMRNAATPEERQKIADATRTEMQKRAKEKGITLPEPRGPGAGFGPNFAPPFAAPAR